MSEMIIPFTDAQWASHFKAKAEAAEARASEVAKDLRELADMPSSRDLPKLQAFLRERADRLEDADPKEQTP